MIKILFILANLSEGGAQHMIYDLIKYLDKSKFEPFLLCYSGKTSSALEQKVEEICAVQYMYEKGHIGFSSIWRVWKQINSYKPDLIHAHLGGMIYAIPWFFFQKGRKLIVTAHTTPKMAFNKKVEPLLKYLLKVRKNDTRVVAVSKENHAMLCSYLGVSKDVCACVNNGVDLDKFYTKEHAKFTYINVARQDDNKNQDAILEAFHEVHALYLDTQLLLIGDGPCHHKLVDRVKKLGLETSVLLPGMVGDVENYYAISDVYVQASHREALPLSALEAMAAGLPLLSTNVGGMKDIVKGNGVLIPDHDEIALQSEMIAMYTASPERKKTMKNISLVLIQEYSSKKWRKNIQVYILKS